VRILIATDSFPPGCGGSGWSTYELARGLRARGHDLAIVRPRPGHTDGLAEYDGFTVREVGVFAPPIPFVRNYLKSERLYAGLSRILAAVAAETRAEVLHGQHVMTIPPVVSAAKAAGLPSIATVRDYWPVCYWSDLIHDPDAETLCPACSARGMRACVRPRAGSAWPLALPMVPYMRANLSRKQQALAAATRVIAVSSTIARDLRERSAGLRDDRLLTIPNPVDVASVRAQAAATPAPPIEGRFALYMGKLAPNKGTRHLLRAVDACSLPWPLVIVGDGPDRPMVEQWARASSRDVRLTGWLRREEALAYLTRAAVLIFPSHGPESLSRVLLEASALGVAIAAMDTGGTRDIVLPGRTGLLSSGAEQLARDVATLVSDRHLAATLGAAARQHVEAHFAAPQVVARIEGVYRDAVASHG
jgi:glycogen synthase